MLLLAVLQVSPRRNHLFLLISQHRIQLQCLLVFQLEPLRDRL